MPNNDIQLSRRLFNQQISDREKLDLIPSPSGDLATVSDRANLAQAIINRLLTRKGELAKLGHPNYGSRLHTLIGELNNTRVRGFAALYIRECLQQESRIEKITQITFSPSSRNLDRDTLDITISLKPVGDPNDLTFTFSLKL